MLLSDHYYFVVCNDVADNVISICRLYADDNSLQQCLDNICLIEQNLNHDLRILDGWSKKWLLKFNPHKTKAALFHLRIGQQSPKTFFDKFQFFNMCYTTQTHRDFIVFKIRMV